MPSKVTDTFFSILCRYKNLPYIALRKRTTLYLVPHPPTRPADLTFKAVANTISERNNKYIQYFTSARFRQDKLSKEDLGISTQMLSNQKISTNQKNYGQQQKKLLTPQQPTSQQQTSQQQTPQQSSQQQTLQQTPQQTPPHQSNSKNYRQICLQYRQKYRDPIQLINLNAFHLFLRDQSRKLNLALQQQKQDTQVVKGYNKQGKPIMVRRSAKVKKGIEKSAQNILNRNQLNWNAKWKNLPQQDKQPYYDIENQIKQQNAQKILKFIQNHQIPSKKRYSVISRFTSRYAPLHKLSLKDPKLYEMWHKLPQTQKKQYSDQAKQMNRQSKENYQKFLKKWDLSEEMLNDIVKVSLEYRKARAAKFVEVRKEKFEERKSRDYDWFEDDETEEEEVEQGEPERDREVEEEEEDKQEAVKKGSAKEVNDKEISETLQKKKKK